MFFSISNSLEVEVSIGGKKDFKLLLNNANNDLDFIILMEKESKIEMKEIDNKEIYYLNVELLCVL